uniref:lipid-A-disaccharide synthase n=1 Tax=Rhodosorus marinus TaxID=101924 RepID=A0A7S0BHL1_9RHOD|mmetsp:Transcript_17165/g.24608  ORF Transcript_17165/g.24608 Transcript_17165/m.24608 type:complete len:275 (+) Transcript_17165:523-1347(+)
MALKVLLVAGEASGDAIGAHLMSALRKQLRCEVSFWGVGGDLMRSKRMDKEIFRMEELSFMGLKEVFSRIPHFLRLKRRVVNAALGEKPDCIIFIDSNGFSGRVAKSLKHEYKNLHEPTPPMFQYVAPSIWAWKRPWHRSRRFANLFDSMLLLYPFEEPHWTELGAENTVYVGSPLLDNSALLSIRKDSVAGEQVRSRIRALYGVGQTEKFVALLPGSRTQEVSRHLGLFFEVLRQTSVSRALLPYASPVRSLIEDYCAKDKSIDVTLVPGGGL